MKIIHVTQFFHPSRGYQENHLAILQSKEGHQVTIVCTDDLSLWKVSKEEMIELDKVFSRKYNIKIIRLKKTLEFSTRIFVSGLNKTLDKNIPDLLIIHAVSLPMSLQAMKWGAKRNIKMIVDDHMVEAGSFNKLAKYFYMFYRMLFPLYLNFFDIKVEKWIAVSKETKEFMIKNYGITDNIEIIPLGYDDNMVYKDINGGKQWLKENNLPTEDSLYILYIGKFDYMKNPIDLLEPFSVFVKKNSDYKLLMVGDSSKEYINEMQSKIEKLDLKNKVFIRKSVPNNQIRKVFSMVQMAIWPHGSSMAMLEAMACECPVIAPDIRVNQERLSEGRGALYIENDNLDLITKMEYTLKNREEIIKKAKQWVSHYSWRKLACDFIH